MTDVVGCVAMSHGPQLLVTGTSEIRNWIVVAGAAGAAGKTVDYAPCYRNDRGVGCAMGFAVWDT